MSKFNELYEKINQTIRDSFTKTTLQKAKKDGLQVQGDFIVVYHGTSESNLKKIVRSGKFNMGSFFASDYDTAMKYAKGMSNKPVVTMAIVYAGSVLPSTMYWTSNEDLYEMGGVYQPKDLMHSSDIKRS